MGTLDFLCIFSYICFDTITRHTLKLGQNIIVHLYEACGKEVADIQCVRLCMINTLFTPRPRPWLLQRAPGKKAWVG